MCHVKSRRGLTQNGETLSMESSLFEKILKVFIIKPAFNQKTGNKFMKTDIGKIVGIENNKAVKPLRMFS